MIHEVDSALKQMITENALRGTDVTVVFDAPTKDWAARRNAPTVNLYLYDIREDLRRRTRGLLNEYTDGVVVARHLPPRYLKLSYLVTAWTQRPEDEHRLLSDLLLTFFAHERIPRELLTGHLDTLGLPVPLLVAQPPPEDRSFADVWTALGGELKPSLDIVVSAPITAAAVLEVGPPVTEGVIVTVNSDDAVQHAPVPGEERVAMRRRIALKERPAGRPGPARGTGSGPLRPTGGPASGGFGAAGSGGGFGAPSRTPGPAGDTEEPPEQPKPRKRGGNK